MKTTLTAMALITAFATMTTSAEALYGPAAGVGVGASVAGVGVGAGIAAGPRYAPGYGYAATAPGYGYGAVASGCSTCAPAPVCATCQPQYAPVQYERVCSSCNPCDRGWGPFGLFGIFS